MRIYAVIDTNVLVSAILSRHDDSATARVASAMLTGKITPVLNEEIMREYVDVLHRPKLHLDEGAVSRMLDEIREKGLLSNRVPTDDYIGDSKDVVFYEVALSKEGAYLVTGNTRHFPVKPIVVTPAEMVAILEDLGIIDRMRD